MSSEDPEFSGEIPSPDELESDPTVRVVEGEFIIDPSDPLGLNLIFVDNK